MKFGFRMNGDLPVLRESQRLFSLEFYGVLCSWKFVFYNVSHSKFPHVSVKHDSSAQPAWATAKSRSVAFMMHSEVATLQPV